MLALEQLPVDVHAAIDLYYFESFSVREIAIVLEAPEGMVKRWLWRGRQLLAKELGE